jgi:putative ABC transport system ATP-binding protein
VNPPPTPGRAVVSARDLSKVYRRGREEVRALVAATFEIRWGEFVAVIGPSGAGKTTLLNLIGCMDTPSDGTLRIGERAVDSLTDRERTRLRRQHIGFVFQQFSLLPTLSVAENVALPALFAGRDAGRRVDELLDTVGLAHRRGHRPHELSGGEMQRAALARALVNEPDLLLADEPTGNLDSAAGDSIIDLFKTLHSRGLCIVVVTHNAALAAAAPRRLELRDGRLQPSSSP